jgi:hypothetical protein
MTSRELVYDTLEFNNPKRIPRDLWVLPWARKFFPDQLLKIQMQYPNDFAKPVVKYLTPPKAQGNPHSIGEYKDEWGCVFLNKQEGIIGEVKSPLLCNLSEWEKIVVPNELLSFEINQINDFCASTDKFILAGCYQRPFERLQFIRGTENLYFDIALETPDLFKLIKKVHQFYLDELEKWSKTDIDGLFLMDDWGSQNSLLISPAQWRKIFKPLYKDYIDIAKKYKKKIFMHSDGFILDIIQDLIDLGLDALNSQLFCMGVPEIGRRFKGQLTFWGEIDRQHILSEGSQQEVFDAVDLVKENLYSKGGVIAQCEFGPGCKPENIEAVFQRWDK